jgi:hypothetical protein
LRREIVFVMARSFFVRGLRRLEKKALQRCARLAALNQARSGLGGQGADLVD